MNRRFGSAVTLMAFAFQPLANAQISQTCPNGANDVCFSLNIPEQTASSGNGDIYFQISAPTTYEWVGLGQGSAMAGSNIFVMYTSANGQNVTVSPRVGTGHVEPSNDGATARISILDGSMISNGRMTANVRCSNCNSWNGGTMNFAGSNGEWIHASKSGAALNSDDLNADISYHDDHGVFSWDFAAAKGGSEVNPFLTSAATSTTNTTAAPASGGVPSNLPEIKKAHGVLAMLAFVIFFPSGGIMIRIGTASHTLAIHRGIQLFALVLFIPAMGMGAWMTHELGLLSEKHVIIGIVVTILVFLQPITGNMHHMWFKKIQARSLWSHGHIWLGRSAIILGMVNGGLGLKLAGKYTPNKDFKIAYGVLAGIFGVAYLISIAFGESRRVKTKRSGSGSDQEMVTAVSEK